jgi:hypothetical protein
MEKSNLLLVKMGVINFLALVGVIVSYYNEMPMIAVCISSVSMIINYSLSTFTPLSSK